MKKNSSILLVEDDPDDVYFVSDALRRSGVELPLEIVHDGQEAMAFLRKATEPIADASRPCLVLLDLNLPRRTGFDVLKWIREDLNWKELVVIVLTSSTSEADMERAYLLGANSYLIKPSDATKLREIAQLLKHYWLGWNQTPARAAATT